MGFTQAIRTCLTKYVDFTGRASRPEYWWFVLFVVLGGALLSGLDAAIFGTGPDAQPLLSSLFQIATFLPLLAAGWRRLHDTGRPGWWILLPMLVTLLFVFGLLGGIVAFGTIERAGVDSEVLRGPAAFLGMTGFAVLWVIELVLLLLMIWWLTRPSEPGPNAYGPPSGLPG